MEPLSMRAWNDDTAEFYLNGVLAATRNYAGRRYGEFTLLGEAVASLRPGRNVLAIHCLDTGGATRRIDAGLFHDRGQNRWIDRLTRHLQDDPDNIYLLQARMNAYAQSNDKDKAKADAEHLSSLLKQDVLAEMADQRIEASEKVTVFAQAIMQASVDDSNWQILSPIDMESAGGATLEALPDDSILASGLNPIGDVYTILTKPSLDQIGAIRLEALTHPSLPDNGPGRAAPKAAGVFALIRWDLTCSSPNEQGEERTIQTREAWADHTMNADDDVNGGHWNITYGAGEPHIALFRVEPPVPFTKGDRLRFKMSFNRSTEWPRQNLGRFRLSLASDPDTFDRQKLIQTMQTTGSGWNDLAAVAAEVGCQRLLNLLPKMRMRLLLPKRNHVSPWRPKLIAWML